MCAIDCMFCSRHSSINVCLSIRMCALMVACSAVDVVLRMLVCVYKCACYWLHVLHLT